MVATKIPFYKGNTSIAFGRQTEIYPNKWAFILQASNGQKLKIDEYGCMELDNEVIGENEALLNWAKQFFTDLSKH